MGIDNLDESAEENFIDDSISDELERLKNPRPILSERQFDKVGESTDANSVDHSISGVLEQLQDPGQIDNLVESPAANSIDHTESGEPEQPRNLERNDEASASKGERIAKLAAAFAVAMNVWLESSGYEGHEADLIKQAAAVAEAHATAELSKPKVKEPWPDPPGISGPPSPSAGPDFPFNVRISSTAATLEGVQADAANLYIDVRSAGYNARYVFERTSGIDQYSTDQPHEPYESNNGWMLSIIEDKKVEGETRWPKVNPWDSARADAKARVISHDATSNKRGDQPRRY